MSGILLASRSGDAVRIAVPMWLVSEAVAVLALVGGLGWRAAEWSSAGAVGG